MRRNSPKLRFKPGLMLILGNQSLDLLVSAKLVIADQIDEESEICLNQFKRVLKLQRQLFNQGESEDNYFFPRFIVEFYEIYEYDEFNYSSGEIEIAKSYNLDLIFNDLGGKWHDQVNGLTTTKPKHWI